jgi:hypothetical protein
MYPFIGNKVIGDKDELLLPAANLTGADDPTMYFDYAYAQRLGSENDKLEVFASSDCGNTWDLVWSGQGAGLKTANAVSNNTFVPSATQWTNTGEFSLPGFNKSKVFVKFVVTNDNGNALYLDNINLWQKNLVGMNALTGNVTSLKIGPNPANLVTDIQINAASDMRAEISITNALGQLVLVKKRRPEHRQQQCYG